MITFLKCEKAGDDGKNLGFALLADDGKTYPFAISVECFMSLFAMGWKAAKRLPPAPDQGEAHGLETEAAFAIVNMRPSLLLRSGPLVLAIRLDAQQLASLQTDIARFARESDQTH